MLSSSRARPDSAPSTDALTSPLLAIPSDRRISRLMCRSVAYVCSSRRPRYQPFDRSVWPPGRSDRMRFNTSSAGVCGLTIEMTSSSKASIVKWSPGLRLR